MKCNKLECKFYDTTKKNNCQMEIGYTDCIVFSMKEAILQTKCNNYLRKNNIDFVHIEKGKSKNKTHRKNIADLIIFYDKDNTLFIELKKNGGIMSKGQKDYFIDKFEKVFKIFVIDNYESFIKIFDDIKLYKHLFFKSESYINSYELYKKLTKVK